MIAYLRVVSFAVLLGLGAVFPAAALLGEGHWGYHSAHYRKCRLRRHRCCGPRTGHGCYKPDNDELWSRTPSIRIAFVSAECLSVATNSIAIAIKPINIIADHPDRTLDIRRTVTATACTVNVAGDRNAGS